MTHKRKGANGRESVPRWDCFDSVRTKDTGGSTRSLGDTISLTARLPATHREQVEAITKQVQPPIAIESLAEILNKKQFVRGKTIYGLVGDEIDKIAVQYGSMRWWISKDGLNMAIVSPTVPRLSEFDKFAGKLYIAGSKDGKLPKALLLSIAKALDAGGFLLKELQPAQWSVISQHNQKQAKQAAKSFEQACRNPRLVRSIRKRLYVARDRCLNAKRPTTTFSSVS